MFVNGGELLLAQVGGLAPLLVDGILRATAVAVPVATLTFSTIQAVEVVEVPAKSTKSL